MELGVPIKIRGTSGKYVAFISYRDVPEFRAVKADSEMGKLILDCVAKGKRVPDEYKTRIRNESRRCAINEIIETH